MSIHSRETIFSARKICDFLKETGPMTSMSILQKYQADIDASVPPTRITDCLKYLAIARVVKKTIGGEWQLLIADYHNNPFESVVPMDTKSEERAIEAERKFKDIESRMATMKTSVEGAIKQLKEENTGLKEQLKNTNKEVIIEVQVKRGEKKVRSVVGHFHEKFPKLLKLVQTRKNIFLYGPTGSGKTHICQQLAEANDLGFAFVSCTTGMSETTLAGSLLPIGEKGMFEYIEAEFIRCYEKGGLFLLDEMDAADPNVLLLINSALSNNRLNIPKRHRKCYATRHADFVCIAAANTLGTGGDRLYAGRNKLDASTLDRFLIGKVFLDYDARVEAQLCPDEALRTRYLAVRKAINAHRLERYVSTRFLKDCYEMQVEAEWTTKEMDEALFLGWREEEFNKIKNELRNAGLVL